MADVYIGDTIARLFPGREAREGWPADKVFMVDGRIRPTGGCWNHIAPGFNPDPRKCPICGPWVSMERGLVDVEIVKKGEDSYQDGKTRASTDVKIKTSQGDEVWVPEKDVIARKPNPEDNSG